MWTALLLVTTASFALPPVDIDIGTPKLVSSIVQAGTGPITDPVITNRTQYTPYWEDTQLGREYTELCFVVAAGSSTSSSSPHRVELWYDAAGFPAVQAYVSNDFLVTSTGLQCVDFSDTGAGTVLDGAMFDTAGDLRLDLGQMVWLAFRHGTGSPSLYYEVVNLSTAQRIGRPRTGLPLSGVPTQGVVGLVESATGSLVPATSGQAAVYLVTRD